jgi:hypothetical protein
MKHPVLKFVAFFTVAISVLTSPTNLHARPIPSMSQRIVAHLGSGDCWEDRISRSNLWMSEKYGSTCKIIVLLSGTTERTVTMEYWDEDDGEWYVDTKRRTRNQRAVLKVIPDNCGENYDEYCDGDYEYRIRVLPSKSPKLPALKTGPFIITMVAIDSDSCNGYEDETCY